MQLITADTPEDEFPPANTASEEGLVAVGGEITTGRVLSAYRQGIFPWYSEDQPVLWWSPEPRAILYPDNIKISRSLRKTIRRQEFNITADTAFNEVIEACAGPRRSSPTEGTWITAGMIETYSTLHQQGYAHSIEVWKKEELIGGLYGLALGDAFFGESMFSYQADASKLALVSLAAFAKTNNIDFIDCQLPTNHLSSMGTIDMGREQYLDILGKALKHPDSTRQWHIND